MNTDTLEKLIFSTNRLIRIAAAATGNPTPSAQWRTLSILQVEGPMRVGELAVASRITQPGMTRLLATMVDEELVSRVADRDDSRAWLIELAPKGAAAIDAWRHQLSDALSSSFDDLSDEDWRVLDRAAELLSSRTSTHALHAETAGVSA